MIGVVVHAGRERRLTGGPGSAQQADHYDEVSAPYGNVVLRVFTVGLLFALLFHALNGLCSSRNMNT